MDLQRLQSRRACDRAIVDRNVLYTIVGLSIVVIVVMFLNAIVGYFGKDVPKCDICRAYLWGKREQNQLWDTWTCNEDWSKVELLFFGGRPENGEIKVIDLERLKAAHRYIKGE